MEIGERYVSPSTRKGLGWFVCEPGGRTDEDSESEESPMFEKRKHFECEYSVKTSLLAECMLVRKI